MFTKKREIMGIRYCFLNFNYKYFPANQLHTIYILKHLLELNLYLHEALYLALISFDKLNLYKNTRHSISVTLI